MPTSTTETVEINDDGIISYKETTVETDGGGNVISVSYRRGVYPPSGSPVGITAVDTVGSVSWTANVIAQYQQKIYNEFGEPILLGGG